MIWLTNTVRMITYSVIKDILDCRRGANRGVRAMQIRGGAALLSFRNSIDFILVAALAVTVFMLVRAQQSPNASGGALAAVGSPIGAVKQVEFKPPHEHWFPRASTHAGEVANVNHEGF